MRSDDALVTVSLILAVVAEVAVGAALCQCRVRPTSSLLRGAWILVCFVTLVGNSMIPTLRDVVSIRNEAKGARIRLVIRVLAARAAGILLVTRAADFAPRFTWLGIVTDAGACGVCDVQRTPFCAVASTTATSSLGAHAK